MRFGAAKTARESRASNVEQDGIQREFDKIDRRRRSSNTMKYWEIIADTLDGLNETRL